MCLSSIISYITIKTYTYPDYKNYTNPNQLGNVSHKKNNWLFFVLPSPSFPSCLFPWSAASNLSKHTTLPLFFHSLFTFFANWKHWVFRILFRKFVLSFIISFTHDFAGIKGRSLLWLLNQCILPGYLTLSETFVQDFDMNDKDNITSQAIAKAKSQRG